MIRSHRLRGTILALSTLFLVLVASWVIWWHKVNTTPVLPVVPARHLPSPNAYDHYVAAAKAIRDADHLRYAVDDSVRTPLSPPPTVSGHAPAAVTRDPLDHSWSLTEKEALLRKNTTTLRLMRVGHKQDYLYPWVLSRLATVPLSEMDVMRMSQLIVLDSQVKARKGEWSSAADACLEGIRFSITFPRGAPLSIGFLSWSCRAQAGNELWKVMEHLAVSDVRRVVHQLERITAQRVPLQEMIRNEKLCGQQTLHEIFQKPNWRGWVLENACDFPATRNNFELAAYLIRCEPQQSWRIMTSSKNNALSEYSVVMDGWVRVAARPYSLRFPLPKEPANPFSKIMLTPCHEGMLFGYTKANAQDHLLLTAFALRAYKLDHGVYPVRLTDLVHSYLSKIPSDPFALNASLQYQRTGDNYVLYSIGPDGKDNGGAAVTNCRMPDAPHYVDWDGKGDIVVGINVP